MQNNIAQDFYNYKTLGLMAPTDNITFTHTAECTSYECTGDPKAHKHEGKRKFVNFQDVMCPDCGSALFWKRVKLQGEKI